MNVPPDRVAFIRANTGIARPPLVPEIRLHLAHEALLIWQKTEEELGKMGLPPPFWAFAWAGGQALSRYILDGSAAVAGCRVLDVATGSGLVAIAAMLAGAGQAVASDIDPFAVTAADLNAALNRVSISPSLGNPLLEPADGADVILVGDLFYERELAAQAHAWLKHAQMRGVRILIGDPGRTYLPKKDLIQLAEYHVPVTRDLEDAEIKRSSVWTLRP